MALPSSAGIGLRAPHYRALLESRPAIGWLEVHSENYYGAGGAPIHYLERARALYPLSLHGVGLSLGSTDPLDEPHLDRLEDLIDRFEPALVSDHLSWSSVGGIHFNDLLPLPYTDEALDHLVPRVQAVQDRLGREILIENPSSYLRYRHSAIPEWEFLVELAARSGCGILLDVNNVYVSACNHGFDAQTYIRAMPPARVREIHLAGHTVKTYPDGELRIDTHDRPVCAEVWELYRAAATLLPRAPALVEWDSELPPLETLVAEARRADAVRSEAHAAAA